MGKEQSKSQRTEGKRRISHPLFFLSLGTALLSLLLHLLSMRSQTLADFAVSYISPLLRKTLGYLSALFPFSLAEAAVITSPAWITLLVLFVRRAAKDAKRARRMLSALLSVPLLLYSLFVLSFAVGYYATPLADRLSLTEEEPTAERLYELTLFLAEEAERNAALAGVSVQDRGSEMPFSTAEMNKKLIEAYDAVEEKHGILSNFAVGVKTVALSHPMAYTQITGVYTFMTGEMNVCTAFPDFSVITTAAHEMAHARGIAREDEANFVAFLACEASSDPYVRYAGYTDLLQYVSSALYKTDKELYRQAFLTYSDTVVAELRAYNRVIENYSDSLASEIAGGINNAYLESMGTEGSVSYGLVVRLAVRYLK